MMRILRRWPPLLWLLVYPGSLFVLMWSSRRKEGLLIAGIAMILIAFAGGVYLLFHHWPGHPRPRIFHWAMAGLLAFYVVSAIAAAFAGPEYVAATLLAGAVPGTALALWLATVRAKTPDRERLPHDPAADDDDDQFLGVGMDTETEMGDTPEHSDAEGDPMVARQRRLRNARRPTPRGTR
jgi:peptidoglycan/LPS O-acetylase OafA/YrhL